MLMRIVKALVVALLVVVPAPAFAQASLTGVVKDTSGAVMPGVTVEATSDALIEKVRSAVTDGSGQYRIVDLPPGTYSVGFALSGFASSVREKIELAGSSSGSILRLIWPSARTVGVNASPMPKRLNSIVTVPTEPAAPDCATG